MFLAALVFLGVLGTFERLERVYIYIYIFFFFFTDHQEILGNFVFRFPHSH